MTRKTVVILTILTLAFIILGVISMVMYGPTKTLGSFEAYDNDDVKYLRSARVFNETGKLTYQDPNTSTVFIMPGIILVLSPFVALFGEQGAIVPFKIFQLILSAGSLWLIFLIARRVVGEKIAILAAGLSVLYVADYYAVNTILTEVLFRTLFLALIYITMIAIQSKKIWHYALGGVIWTLAVYFRPTIAMYPLIILALWLKRKYKFNEMLKFGAVVTAVFVIMIAPWWIRNYTEFGKFVPLTLSSGNPMLQGTYINYTKDPAEEEIVDVSQYYYPGNELGNDAVEKQIAWDRILKVMPRKPLQYLGWYTIGKTIYLWQAPFAWTSILGLNDFTSFFIHVIFILLCVAGVMLYFRRKMRNTDGFFLGIILLYFTLVHLPFYAFERYTYPAMPCVIIFAAYFLANCRGRIRSFGRGSNTNKTSASK